MNFSTLTFLDFGILAIIFLSMIFAIFRGFIGSVLSLVGWGLSVYFTYLLYPHFEPLLATKISNQLVLATIGYTVLMIFFLILFAILNNLISSTKLLGLGFVDRTLGGLFGIFRGFLIVSFFYTCISIGISLVHGTNPQDEQKVAPEWLKNSETYRFLQFGKQLLLTFTSNEFNNRLESFYNNISKKNKDDRFISYAMGVMSNSIPQSERRKIEQHSDKESLTKSNSEVETITLRLLLDAYKKQHKNNLNAKLNKEDIDRLQSIINSSTKNENQSNMVDQ